jgi:glycine/D-amino acid oxidase-like deaminating enzyme
VEQLVASPAPGWVLQLDDGTSLAAGQVVLAAGAGCRQLWPGLPEWLRSSWAAVLELPPSALIRGRQAACLPARFGRVELERRAAELSQPEWLVDGGLVPRGEGALLGQHTLVRLGLELGSPPPEGEVEQQLRACLAGQAWAAALAPLPGHLRQAAVAFCTQGVPLVGPVAEAPGLWVFSGFSAGFSQVPVLAPVVAEALVAGGDRSAGAMRRLRQLGLSWPDPPGG